MERRGRRRWRIGFVLAIGFLPAVAVAGMYSYTDDKGEIHFVDSLEKIPDDKLIDLERQGKIPPKGAVTPAPTAAASGGLPGGLPGALPGTPIMGQEGGGQAPPPPPGPGSTEPKTCIVGVLDKPEMTVIVRTTTVRYDGKIQNTGTGTAKAVSVTLTLYSPQDGRILDTRRENTIPLNLAPNQTGSFSVSGDYKKNGLHYKEKDKLVAGYARCD